MALGVSRTKLMEAHWQGGKVSIESILSRCECHARSTEYEIVGCLWLFQRAMLFVDKRLDETAYSTRVGMREQRFIGILGAQLLYIYITILKLLA